MAFERCAVHNCSNVSAFFSRGDSLNGSNGAGALSTALAPDVTGGAHAIDAAFVGLVTPAPVDGVRVAAHAADAVAADAVGLSPPVVARSATVDVVSGLAAVKGGAPWG